VTWPFLKDAAITQRFGDARAAGRHGAWDVASPMGSTIIAPEDGELILFVLNRVGEGMPLKPRGPWIERTHRILPRQLSSYPWYFSDRVGHCACLQGKERWHLFCHLEPGDWWRQLGSRGLHASYEYRYGNGVPPAWKIEIMHSAYDTLPVRVEEGERIAAMGNSGISTGVHCHYEIAPTGYTGGAPSRIDPAEFWPDR
jgi:hypothetical protein